MTTMQINDFHRVVLKDYHNGDFAHFAEQERITRAELVELGDSLLVFLLIELSEEEDCENVGTGIQRLMTARDDLDAALAALGVLQALQINGAPEREVVAVLGGQDA